MTRLLFVLALVLSISFVVVLAQPPFPCTYTNPRDLTYNLTNMWRNPAKGQADFQFSGTSDGSVFWVNICGQSAQTACNPANGVCQVARDGSGYGEGDASTAKWSTLDNGANGVKIVISNGSGGPCNGVPRTSYLQISCDITAGDGVIDSVTESFSVKCQFIIVMRSKWACGSPSTPPPPPPPPPPMMPTRCSQNRDCTIRGNYCRMPVGVCGNIKEPIGTCEPTPQFCTKEYSPTCGCDYVTYSNPCAAAANGTSVLYRGPCDFTATCNATTVCGRGQYCSFPPGSCGTGAGSIGFCDGVPKLCPLNYAPVCGCDGNTYSNECHAQGNKVSIRSYGECPTRCKSDSDCKDADSFCDMPKCTSPGACIVAPQFCNLMYSPVCGCNNRTYSNTCYAQAAYMSIAYKGACH